MKVDAQAIERRLQLLKPKSRHKSNLHARRYLPQRPATATAAGQGARAARSLRSRPSTAPAILRTTKQLELRVVFRLVIAAGRFAKGAEVPTTGSSFFITSSAVAAARRARMC